MAFEELKQRQSVVWGSGPYEPIVHMTAEIHDRLVEVLDPKPGERWLDVACGTGAVSLLAARGGADVTGVDLAPALIETARRKAEAAGLEVRFDVGDAESLPYDDEAFDVVVSAIGAMFAPDHGAVARELARVCRPGGRLAMANWGHGPGAADIFRVMKPFSPPPPPGVGDPFDWGDEEHVRDLLGEAFELELRIEHTPLVEESGAAVWERLSTAYGPTKTLVESLEPERREELRDTMIEFFEKYRENGSIRHDREYLLVLGRRR